MNSDNIIRLKCSLLASVLFIGLSISGCSSKNLHDSQSWISPPDTEKVTSDWDVAEAVCDKVALGEKLTEAEQDLMSFNQEVTKINEESLVQSMDELSSINPLFGKAAKALEILGPFVRSFGASTAEEGKKEKAFVECMKKLGWSVS